MKIAKNNLVKTFQMRHRFIANSCGEKFMMAYDKYLNKVSELREAEYIEAINKKNAKEREKEEWEEEIRLAKQARDRADAEREEQARLMMLRSGKIDKKLIYAKVLIIISYL
ncbi:hypothetical protein [Acinetobacter baumannii]|uniref:hypothetical protein n=1 Tax=Acinetobacter baumannii TaxID=470 RepID=UPI001E486803|nr:hypothetical protein [Acinetobacter baumannii]